MVFHNMDDFLKDLFRYVSNERKKKIESFKFYNDSYRALIAALIARYAIIKRTNLKNSTLIFDKNTYGKPYLCNTTKEEIHFNISHSGDYVICLIDNDSCGCDVEKHDKKHIDLAEATFHL